jgi:hypothetical protein
VVPVIDPIHTGRHVRQGVFGDFAVHTHARHERAGGTAQVTVLPRLKFDRFRVVAACRRPLLQQRQHFAVAGNAT